MIEFQTIAILLMKQASDSLYVYFHQYYVRNECELLFFTDTPSPLMPLFFSLKLWWVKLSIAKLDKVESKNKKLSKFNELSTVSKSFEVIKNP